MNRCGRRAIRESPAYYEASSKTRVILSERSESKNLRNEGQQCRNDNAKILRLRTSCFAQDDRDFR